MGNELSKHIEQSQKSGVLQLRNFKLNKIPPEINSIARNLRTLDLSTNRIDEIPGVLFQNLVNVKTLSLDNNKIEIIPNEIGFMIKLENFSLNENLLTKLPATILKLKNLKKIHLSKNKFSIIPNELFQFKLLDHVDLSSNRISSIDDSVLTFDCIELNLNDNQIKTISNNISKCQRLKVLRLEQNLLELKSIPKCLLADTNVSLLALEGNLFTQKQFQEIEGYEKYMERYTATKRKFD